MDDITHANLSIHAKEEIDRLNGLLLTIKEKQSIRRKLRGLAEFIDIKITGADPNADRHFKTSAYFISIKIQIWKQLIERAKNPNMLDILNDALNKFLIAGWSYLSQENLVSESQLAKEEYKMFKMILNALPDKPKKPRRRGGKKHKKNNKQEEDK